MFIVFGDMLVCWLGKQELDGDKMVFHNFKTEHLHAFVESQDVYKKQDNWKTFKRFTYCHELVIVLIMACVKINL